MQGKEINIGTKTLIRFWLVIIGFVLVLGALWLARDAAIMLLIAFFLAIMLNRPTAFFARILPGNSRALGAFISFIITLIVLLGTVVLIVPVFLEQSTNFAKSLPDTIVQVEEQSRFVMDFARNCGYGDVVDSIIGSISGQASNIANNLGSVSVGFVTDFFNGVMSTFLVAILTFFMLLEGPAWLEKFWKYVYRDPKKRAHHKAIADKMYDVFSTFVTSQIIVAAINGVLAGLGVFVMAMTFGFTMSLILPIAAIVFVATFVPVFGPFISGALSFLLILLYNPIAAIIFVVYLILFQQLVYNLLAPKIQGQRMNMSPLVVLAAMIIGLQIAGVFGALVAIPLAGCTAVIIRSGLTKYKNTKSIKAKS
ncbi:AI-2E family transporter [Alphaproteobacteria bacterium]|nr:AI-2E family transporter [Alphaproteobacteria bacterium]